MPVRRSRGDLEAAAATNTHYEQSVEAFRAFLDQRMKYSCALFADSRMSLDEAQVAHLRLIAGRLRLRGGERVLDVGCGWGSLSLLLATEFGCTVVSVTPSAGQAAYIGQQAVAAGVADRVEVRIGPFQATDLPDRSFDAVAIVEAIEHMPEHRGPLRRARRLLRHDGRLFLSASCYRTSAARREYEKRPASVHALGLYGFTAMVPLSQLVSEIEDAGFSVVSLTDMTKHYTVTMDHWLERLERGEHLIEGRQPGLAGELRRYFCAARASWGYTAKLYALTGVRSGMGNTDLLPVDSRDCAH